MDELKIDNEKNAKAIMWMRLIDLKDEVDIKVLDDILLDLTFVELVKSMKKRNKFNINDHIEQIEREISLEKFKEYLQKYPQIEKMMIEKEAEFPVVEDEARFFINVLDHLGKTYKKQEIYVTPESIIKLVVDLTKDKKTDSIYDATIGTGVLTTTVLKNHKDAQLYGQELYHNKANICKQILVLMGKFDLLSNIKCGNVLLEPYFVKDNKVEQFDLVISHHPFAILGNNLEVLKNDVYNRFHRGLPPKSDFDYAFLSHSVESINDKGIGVCIVHGGILFRKYKEGAIRTQFVKENLIDTVIALPGNMLYGTSIPINIIIFNKAKKDKDILFIDASSKGERGKIVTMLSDEAIKEIVDVYNKREAVKNFSTLVSMDKIDENDYNLSVQRYVDVDDRKYIDIDKISDEIKVIKEKLNLVQSELDELMGI